MLDRDIHPIDRKTALLYFVSRTGPLQRVQVNRMAKVLYDDTKQGQIKDLADIAQRSGIALPASRRFFGDPTWVLHQLAVEYQQAEFEHTFPIINNGDFPPRFLDEWAAGGGVPRPLVKDLLRMCSFREMYVDIKDLFTRNEQYWLTNFGAEHVRALNVIFKYSPVLYDSSSLLVAGRELQDARLIHQEQPPLKSL